MTDIPAKQRFLAGHDGRRLFLNLLFACLLSCLTCLCQSASAQSKDRQGRDIYSNADDADLEFRLDCSHSTLLIETCDGDLYSHSENIAFRLDIPGGTAADIPSIASMTMRMFKSWMENPQN